MPPSPNSPEPPQPQAMSTSERGTAPGAYPSTGSVSMKRQISDLTNLNALQLSSLETLQLQVSQMSVILGPNGGEGLNALITGKVEEVEAKLSKVITSQTEEFEHKFSLQVAENKRMTQHLSNCKRENQAMGKRVVALEERVAGLEIELGGDE